MCYDISFTVNMRQLSDYFPDLIFDSQIILEFEPFDHIQGPSLWKPHPIIYENKDDKKLHCRLMEWSVVEFYNTEKPKNLKDPFYHKKRNGMLNIRSEKVLDDPKSYWYKIKSKRALMPVTGIFEHREILKWKKKVPYIVKPCDQEIFFLPGLYSVVVYVDKDTGEVSDPVWTFALMTRWANEVMSKIHNSGDNPFRMPLFLPFNLAQEYISSNLTSERYREILNYEMPSEELQFKPVNTIRTSKLRDDGKPKTEPWDWGGILPDLGLQGPEIKQNPKNPIPERFFVK